MILLYIIITLDLSSVVYNVKVDFIYTFFNILLAASFRINYIIEERKKENGNLNTMYIWLLYYLYLYLTI
jgi:hypothetical protein